MAKRVFKTDRKLSGGNQVFRKWSEWKEGEYIVGKFMSTHVDTYDKDAWVIEVETAGFQDSKLAETIEGKNLVLNSTGMLDKAMKQVKVGEFVEVTYNGTSTIEKGPYKGKASHSVTVNTMVEDDSAGDEDLDL